MESESGVRLYPPSPDREGFGRCRAVISAAFADTTRARAISSSALKYQAMYVRVSRSSFAGGHGSAGACASQDYTIATGALPNGGLPTITVTTNNKAALYGGYLVVGTYQGATNQSFILDADGAFLGRSENFRRDAGLAH